MGAAKAIVTTAATTATMLATLSVAPQAQADAPNLNGAYQAISNGQYAKTDEVFIDERTVVETWNFATTCKSPIECTGEVTSSGGWTAPVTYDGDIWNIKRVISNWEPCPDGTAADGVQQFFFWSIDPVTNERHPTSTGLLAGRNMTLAPSGACGINKNLQIELPLRLTKL